MKITAAIENDVITLTAHVKVNIYSGVYMYPDGSVNSSRYDEDFVTKADLLEIFKNDCEGNGATPIKFVKIGTEKRGYKKTLTTSDFLFSDSFEIEESTLTSR